MKIEQTPAFKRIYKKLHGGPKSAVNEAIQRVYADPTIGEEKKQDLKGIYVYKFPVNDVQYLLAYTFDPITLKLLLVGVHENFYRTLKGKLK